MKRTIKNCSLIKRAIENGIGSPDTNFSKCLGYAVSEEDDEPCNTCKRCRLNTLYEDERTV